MATAAVTPPIPELPRITIATNVVIAVRRIGLMATPYSRHFIDAYGVFLLYTGAKGENRCYTARSAKRQKTLQSDVEIWAESFVALTERQPQRRLEHLPGRYVR
jgi:hypothetical protein